MQSEQTRSPFPPVFSYDNYVDLGVGQVHSLRVMGLSSLGLVVAVIVMKIPRRMHYTTLLSCGWRSQMYLGGALASLGTMGADTEKHLLQAVFVLPVN